MSFTVLRVTISRYTLSMVAGKKINVLLLDDADHYPAQLRSQLAEMPMQSQLFWVKTVDRALHLLHNLHIDIALINNLLTKGETGFDLLTHPEFKGMWVPSIFIAEYGEEYTAVKALRAGAFDYVIKDQCDSPRLFTIITAAIRDSNYRRKTELHQIELVKLVTTDALTKLCNRRHFIRALDSEIFRYLRYKLTLSVAILDIDDFKHVNTQLGRDGGDAILQCVGNLIEKTIRSTDTVCRYGNDEFAIIFPSTDLAGVERFSERLRNAVADKKFYHTHIPTCLTVSIGVAEAFPEIANSDMLLKLADKALYAAKQDGGNRVVSYKYGNGI